MLNLPDVTLVTLTGIGYKTQEHLDALKKSQEGIKFGEVKFIQLGSIVDVNTWNEAVIYKLPKYIDTLYCLLIHHDGYVINPQLWKDEWLQYDYAGSPWPLPTDDYSYKSESGYLVRVGNSVGLRSKKLMNLVTTREWKSYYGNTNEDGFIACHNREWLEDRGCKFMPFDEALMFGKEAELLENKDLQTFLFHTHG